MHEINFSGVPKLNRLELENACEDFSNIVCNQDTFTVYKGTLSSGVEISVVSTAINSLKDWSKRSELAFRKKVSCHLLQIKSSFIIYYHLTLSVVI